MPPEHADEWVVPHAGLPPWKMLAAGVLAGVLIALIAGQIWNVFDDGDGPGEGNGLAPNGADIACFRLPWGGEHELLLVPAGPDGLGEPRLAARLFPDETPARRLASLVLANVSPDTQWEVDLGSEPFLAQIAGSDEWQRIDPVTSDDGIAVDLDAADALRLRALATGAPGGSRLTLEPRSLRRVLVALPPRRGLADISGVKWGATDLLPDRISAETLRSFRVDPARVGALR